MNAMKKIMALLLVFALAVSCVPLGAVTAFAAEIDEGEVPSTDATDPTVPEETTETQPPAEIAEAPTDETETLTEPVTVEAVTDEEAVQEAEEPSEAPPEIMMFAASPASDDSEGGSSGSETGDGGDGGGNSAGDGSNNMIAVGVTMQIVYYRYDECYNRYNSHENVIDTLKTGKAIPWNDTGKDLGATATTVFDTFTITPHTFIAKACWPSYPYVYHFPTENLKDDNCKFTWTGWKNFWFNYENPGGSASTYPRIVRNEEGGSAAIENFLARIILGNDYGAWDKLDIAKGETVATDFSLFAEVLKYLGASDLAIQICPSGRTQHPA